MLSLAPQLDHSSLLRLKQKAAKRPQTSLSFSKESEPTAASLSWRDRLTMLWQLCKTRFVSMLLNLRNRSPKVLQYPDFRLKRVSDPVDFENTTLTERTTLVRKMGAALAAQTYGHKLGIAAPQIGISKRVMIVHGAVMFNPEWQPPKSFMRGEACSQMVLEGCYSAPDRLFKVRRAEYGWGKWQSVDGAVREFKLKGQDAIIFQHELDHLDGRCCPDVGQEVPRSILRESKK